MRPKEKNNMKLVKLCFFVREVKNVGNNEAVRTHILESSRPEQRVARYSLGYLYIFSMISLFMTSSHRLQVKLVNASEEARFELSPNTEAISR